MAMYKPLKPIGAFLISLLHKHREKQIDMANRLGSTAAMISAMKKGKRKPTARMCKRIIEAYSLNDNEVSELKVALVMSGFYSTVEKMDKKQEEADEKRAKILFKKLLLCEKSIERKEAYWLIDFIRNRTRLEEEHD